jgi:hypothetical protein
MGDEMDASIHRTGVAMLKVMGAQTYSFPELPIGENTALLCRKFKEMWVSWLFFFSD